MRLSSAQFGIVLFFIDQEQIIGATLYEFIKIWFQSLTNSIRVKTKKRQFLNFFRTDSFTFLLKMFQVARTFFFTPLNQEINHYLANFSAAEEKGEFSDPGYINKSLKPSIDSFIEGNFDQLLLAM